MWACHPRKISYYNLDIVSRFAALGTDQLVAVLPHGPDPFVEGLDVGDLAAAGDSVVIDRQVGRCNLLIVSRFAALRRYQRVHRVPHDPPADELGRGRRSCRGPPW